MHYEIDENIPLPDRHGGPGGPVGWSDKYGLRKMKHGDSVWFANWQKAKNMYSTAYRRWRAERITVKPAMRSVGAGDPKGEGYRVWFFDPKEVAHGSHP